MPDVAFLNRQFLPIEQATVSINDRGFVFADGVYEALRTYNGIPYAIDRHVRRLHRSLSELEISYPQEFEQLEQIMTEGCSRAGYEESLIYVQITRGTAPRAHIISAGLEPTLLVTIREYHPHAAACYEQGVETITVTDERWGRCDIKTICLLPNTIAKTKAHRAGAYEAILVGQDGMVHEGSSSNLAIVRDGDVITHPADHQILWGVTREIVLEEARSTGLEVIERPFSVETLLKADEAFLMGTTYEVMPVCKVNGKTIGSGQPGPVSRQLLELYRSQTGTAYTGMLQTGT